MNEKERQILLRAVALIRAQNPEMTTEEAEALTRALGSDDAGAVVDITYPWKVAMDVLGHADVTEHIGRVDVIVAPPVVLIGIAVEASHMLDKDNLTPDQNEAMSKSFAAVLRQNGWPIEVGTGGMLQFNVEQMHTLMREAQDPWASTIQAFRSELDAIYPDKQDPLSKWMNQEDD